MNKDYIAQFFDSIAERRSYWFTHNHIYHEQTIEACRPYINPGTRILELGCSVGDLLGSLNPDYGVGVDISPKSIEYARKSYPHLQWYCSDVEDLPLELMEQPPFDIIIVEDLLGYVNDVEKFLTDIKALMHEKSRLIISTWNWLWYPVLKMVEHFGLKTPDLDMKQNWVSATSLELFLKLSDYNLLDVKPGLVLPYKLPVITEMINSISYAPLVRRFTLLTTLVARPVFDTLPKKEYSVSVVVPTRNEAGNIPTLVKQIPQMGSHTEIIFIDGNSTDGTVEEIKRQIDKHPELDIKFMPQIPEYHSDVQTPPNLMLKLGKGDAVRKAFDTARGDILMILDSDVSVPPSELQRFYNVLSSGKADFANGTRFVYSQEVHAMRSINRFGNVFFSFLFSWLLGQRITDTLCGTKVLFRKHYEDMKAARSYFGDFDPFGDFELLYGAVWLGLSIIDVPVHYLSRTYGTSKVRVGLHGPLLGKMSLFALWHFKIRPVFSRVNPTLAPETSMKAKQRLRFPFVISMILTILALVFFVIRKTRR